MLLNLKKSDLARPIYRIVSLERLVELFTAQENVLVNPSKWEDTFENFILKAKVKSKTGEIFDGDLRDSVFGQCWTLHNASDAMWRIYSPNKDGLRIKSTIGELLQGIYQVHQPDAKQKCAIGLVEYKTLKKLFWHANNTYEFDTSIFVENVFRSLLLKRLPFVHEKEVRLLFQSWFPDLLQDGIYRYKIDPHSFVKEVMIDPRRSYDEFKTLKHIIQRSTNFKGSIKRSQLYKLPKDRILEVKDDCGF